MFNRKFLTGVLLVLAVLFAQTGNVSAAPQTQDTTPLAGTIKSIVTETDANNVTTVLVTFVDDQGTTQIVRLSLEIADGLNLVDLTTLEVDETQIGQPVTIDPTTVIPDDDSAEPDVHPISALLANFFFPDDESMASVIDGFHSGDNDAEQVFGFGVIAQTLWMTRDSDGKADAELAGLILEAKQTGKYEELLSEYFDFGDEPFPTNWGQFKKEIKAQNENKDKHNLGVIVSEQAEDDPEDAASQQDHGNGKDKKDKVKEKKEKKK